MLTKTQSGLIVLTDKEAALGLAESAAGAASETFWQAVDDFFLCCTTRRHMQHNAYKMTAQQITAALIQPVILMTRSVGDAQAGRNDEDEDVGRSTAGTVQYWFVILYTVASWLFIMTTPTLSLLAKYTALSDISLLLLIRVRI